ncbi:hypothetical protein [Paenibacillus sp. FSL K6-1318]|uniref:NACHT domain-containing protein n=1 Tax=Paenibacillus sp. FSL K6-1318 TaxID=2975291 RepID=UPI0030EB3D37
MFEVNWNKFNIKNADKEEAFERMCRHLFMRKFKISGYEFSVNYNQTGLETEPVKSGEKFYGFQCKYSTSHNSTLFYDQVYNSLKKAFTLYEGKLDEIYIYSNLNIKPECTSEELSNDKLTTSRVMIQKEARRMNITIHWIKEENFTHILNEVENHDIYRMYFSSQNEIAFIDSSVTVEEKTFLKSNSFLEISINGFEYTQIEKEILKNNFSVILGYAGTGKTEILKKIYVCSSEKFLENYSQNNKVSIESIPIPIYIRLRECVMGDLESLIRNRLKDYSIPFGDNGQKCLYIFDGLDEISISDVDKTISFIKMLKRRKNTENIIVSSRLNSPNLTFLYREMDPKVYQIDALNHEFIDKYFVAKAVQSKSEKYESVKSKIKSLLIEIDDIFSVNLLWEYIENVDDSTTKIDLISHTFYSLLNSSKKIKNLNLPEVKITSIEEILQEVSYFLQLNNSLNLTVNDFQNIISTLYSKLTYYEIDSIINSLTELFFDVAHGEKIQIRYSFKHKRFHEYFLYKKIKHNFYNDPFLLRDLGLFPDKDFVLNIFLFQELKESIRNRDILKNLSLRFFEAYLGRDYWYYFENGLIGQRSDYGVGDESYLQSDKLVDVICTKEYKDLKSFINNQGIGIKSFLSQNNYWDFIKKYILRQNVDIRLFLKAEYNLSDDFEEEAYKLNPCAFWFYKCKQDKASFKKIYTNVISKFNLENVDSELNYLYRQNSAMKTSGYFEIGLEFYVDQLEKIIPELGNDLLEVLCFTLLRTQNIYYLYGETLQKLRNILKERLNSSTKPSYKLNSIIVHNLLAGSRTEDNKFLMERFNEVNKNHYGTWERNLEANSYITILLENEERLCSREYALGVEIRKTIIDFHTTKSGALELIIDCVKKYNFIYDNRFSYNNSQLIGEIISRFEFDENQLKKFIKNLLDYKSVISITTVLYNVFLRNKTLFKSITNIKMLVNINEEELKNLSYYDINTDSNYLFAAMMSCFDMSKADEFLLKAINNSIYRPAFRKDDIISYLLPRCIFLGHQSNWFDEYELKVLLNDTYSMLTIMKSTTDQGGNLEYFKYVLELCIPDSPILNDIYNVISVDIFSHFETDSPTVDLKNISLSELNEYYSCKIHGINYSKINTWKTLVEIEKSVDSELTQIFEVLKKASFPEQHGGKINNYFHIVTSALLDDDSTKEQIITFILKQGGRYGLINMISAFSILGKDDLARKYIHQLFLLCKALVYPNKDYYLVNQLQENEISEINNLVVNSKKLEWISHDEKQEMIYLKNPNIKIIWFEIDKDYPFDEPWATKHPDSNAFKVDYTIVNNGINIDSFSLVYVDGYRALLPLPQNNTNVIRRKNYRLSLLFNDEKILHNYIKRSGLIVE